MPQFADEGSSWELDLVSVDDSLGNLTVESEMVINRSLGIQLLILSINLYLTFVLAGWQH